jgi:two-component system, OmpR family, sensor histidine kinase KdpD
MDERSDAISQLDLMAFIEHEVRNAATIILGNTAAIRRHSWPVTTCNDAERTGDFISTIDEETRSLMSFVSTMIKVSESFGTPTLEPTRLDQIVPSVISRHASSWPDRFIDVEVPPGLPCVLVSKPFLEVVLKNLLYNSHKYSPLQGSIVIKAWDELNSVRLSIRDAGYISEEDVEQIFKMGYRSDRFVEVDGTGVGLTECRSLLRLMDASVDVTRHEGGGLEGTCSPKTRPG